MKMSAISSHAIPAVVLWTTLWACRSGALEISFQQRLSCPPNCRDIFKHLDENGVRNIEVQIRGEPKSGTGTTEDWANGALQGTCKYLQRLYGNQSCGVSAEARHDATVIFEPGLAKLDVDKPCSCDTVERVTLSVSAVDKHKLPMEKDSCSYWHTNNLGDRGSRMCRHPDGHPLRNQVDLWKCIEEAGCEVNDYRLQLAVMRDPRAVTVSMYFHRVRKGQGLEGVPLDSYFQANLELVCQWVSLRYFIFTEVLSEQSELFWFADRKDDPLDWHGRYLDLIGVNLPLDEVQKIAQIASDGLIQSVLSYQSKGIDAHPGSEVPASNRTFRDELGNESLLMMDDVLRKWLPPIVLRRLEVDLP